jgi:multiple antibiotic resistance protein
MTAILTLFINVFLKMFILLTPFFVLSAFLSVTKGMAQPDKQKIAVKVTLSVILICFCLFLFGRYLFAMFGITLDAFRIGAGAVLFLSGISLIQGNTTYSPQEPGEDVSVVPLAIPITVGPGTIGALLVMGAGLKTVSAKITASFGLLCAILAVGCLLIVAGRLEKFLGQQGLTILTKLTGLFISAIAAQIFFTGLKNFLS